MNDTNQPRLMPPDFSPALIEKDGRVEWGEHPAGGGFYFRLSGDDDVDATARNCLRQTVWNALEMRRIFGQWPLPGVEEGEQTAG